MIPNELKVIKTKIVVHVKRLIENGTFPGCFGSTLF